MPEAPLAIDPRVEAAALFNKEGLVRISDEDAEYAAQQNRAVREATGLVWRQYMLRAFDRSVAEGGVKIFARVQSTLAPYRELPRDLWARLDVFEWQQGEARDPEGTVYHSIRAVASSAAPSAKQASVAADEEAAVKALKKELEVDRDMRVAEAISFCESQNFRVSERRIRSRVWPDARKLAGLLPLAPPGRKKSKR
jgi:hypothetical protein